MALSIKALRSDNHPVDSLNPARATSLALILLGFVSVYGCGAPLVGNTAETDAVRETLAKFVSGDSSVCRDGVTPAFLDSYYSGNGIGLGEEGDLPTSAHDPLDACRKAIEAGQQAATDITDVVVRGNTATATVGLNTNSLGIESLTLGLVDRDGWKVDSLREVRLDRPEFLEGMRRQQAGPQASVEQRRYFRCELGWVDRNVSTRELERAIVTQDGSYYLGSFDTCAASYRALVAGLTAAASGSSPTQRACVSRVFGHTIERRDLRQLYEASAAGEGSPVSVEARMRSAIAACQ